jgi:endonuclease-3
MHIKETLSKIKEMNNASCDYTALKDISEDNPTDPFRVLIGTILSQRTRDENTRRATRDLFSHYKNAKELSKGRINVIEKLIKQSGFYHVKARRIRDVAKIIVEKYHGEVPDDINSLLSMPSVGRKTANCVLVYAFNKPAIPVDTHVHRISNRLGIVETRKPEETEVSLRESIDQEFWLELNDLFVKFGQRICTPISPKCKTCKLRNGCTYHLEKKEN